MKLIFQHRQTWELLHNWQRNSLEIVAGFFFHHRGSAIQKSFEGLLRSLVLQLLAPVHEPYVKRYQPTWRTYQSIKEQLSLQQHKLWNAQLGLSNTLQQLRDLKDRDEEFNRLKDLDEKLIRQTGLDKELTRLKNLDEELIRLNDLDEELVRLNDPDKEVEPVKDKEVKRVKDLVKELMNLISGQPSASNSSADRLRHHIASRESRQKRLVAEEARCHAEIMRARAAIASIHLDLAGLEKRHARTPFRTELETKFLNDVLTSFRDHRGPDEVIPRLERILRQLLNQTTINIDVVLFFDALDEFDGHLDMISRFIKTLLRSSTASTTRVKVCMSSRPWETFQEHFASYPGFAVQDHTAQDIEEYAVGSVSAIQNTAVLGLVPTILERANGVFLWVRLAIKILLDTAMLSPESGSAASLEKSIRDLPDDLFEFYEMIVERISKRNRRYTFTLLELLARHKGPAAEAYQIRDAVLISGCKTFGEAARILEQLPQPGASGFGVDAARDARWKQDIHDWSGGLVEVKSLNSILQPQLMHQTVLEFIMGLRFKRMVLGDLANILDENGHSFHVKYWITSRALTLPPPLAEAKPTLVMDPHLDPLGLGHTHRKRPGRPWVPLSAKDNGVLVYRNDQKLDLEIFAFHIEQAELTTGKSQYDFLRGVPYEKLGLFSSEHPQLNKVVCLVSFAASFNLTLCLRDWVTLGLRGWKECFPRLRVVRGRLARWPLLSSLVFFPPVGAFYERYITTARLILESGFDIAEDPFFFSRLVAELWVTKSSADDKLADQATTAIPASALLALAKLALDHGQDPNISIKIFVGEEQRVFYTALHLAPPQLAVELIRHGADPRRVDSEGRPAIQCMLKYPPELAQEDRPSCAYRYEMCKMLISVERGPVNAGVSLEGVEDALAEFAREGYDISILDETLRAHSTPSQVSLDNVESQSKPELTGWLYKLWQYGKW